MNRPFGALAQGTILISITASLESSSRCDGTYTEKEARAAPSCLTRKFKSGTQAARQFLVVAIGCVVVRRGTLMHWRTEMKFANVNGVRCEAQPKMRGECPDPNCGATVVAKCGELKMWHWAHLGARNCDAWWEPETPWHRSWKNSFPVECQEVRHSGSDGEVHIADVRTKNGAVLEFQHSSISREERVSRERFYSPMMWVVDGCRLKRDLQNFMKSLMLAEIYDRSPVCLIMPIQGVSIVQRWAGSTCPVYLDFGDAEFGLPQPIKGPVLWRLAMPKRAGYFTATPISRGSFIEHHISNSPMRGYGLPPQRTARPSSPPRFEAYMAERERRRGRF